MGEETFIRQIPDVLTEHQIQYLVNIIDEQSSNIKASKNDGKWRTNNTNNRKDIQFNMNSYYPFESRDINKTIYDKILFPYFVDFPYLEAFGRDWINGSILIQKTQPGGGYHKFHCETGWWSIKERLLAWMIYLNDVEVGGETEFLYQKTRFKPRKNCALIWPGGFTHIHRGNQPISSDKYVLTGWITPVTGDMNTLPMDYLDKVHQTTNGE